MNAKPSFDIQKVRLDFPVLARRMKDKPLVYLDNAATTQKPWSVINRLNQFYSEEYATVHRGVYSMSQDATLECDAVRRKCRDFLNAASEQEIIFVRGTTEAVNLVAASYGRKFLKKGDAILVSGLEHHANLIPWQQMAREKELELKIIPVTDSGELDFSAYQKMLTPQTKLLAVNHISNAIGTINPVKEMIRLAHEKNAVVLVDGAQAAGHLKVDVRDLDCDFYCFSGHKIYGPTGVGVLYGKREHLEAMEPYQTGGEMVKVVTYEDASFAELPFKFEAGTPAIAEIVGLGCALDYLENLGFETIQSWEHGLLLEATRSLSEIKGLRILGQAREKSAILSFLLDEIHPHDLGTILDQEGVAIRTGNHCTQPLMKRFGVSATARASFSFYNTFDEIEVLVMGLRKAQEMFR